ncbi:MAG: SDR family NAD(P)-dependent oxidoreductase [Alphaproteobacteria bacterium]
MRGRLQGKTALVTAAGQGLGRATAVAFAAEGAHVIATNTESEPFAALAREHPELEARVLDVTDAEGIGRLAESIEGALDALFNCASFVHDGTLLECDDQAWAHSFAVNVTSMFRMCRTFLARMVEAGKSSIVNVASVASSVTGVPRRFAYGASKAAVIGLTKSIAVDFIATGGVREISPSRRPVMAQIALMELLRIHLSQMTETMLSTGLGLRPAAPIASANVVSRALVDPSRSPSQVGPVWVCSTCPAPFIAALA